MTKVANTAFGQNSLTSELNKFLISQSSVLKSIFADDSIEGRAKELKAFLGAIVSTAISISRLASEDLLNECTMLSRGFFERTVNFCYLLVCNKTDFEEDRLPTLQKSYRSLQREFSGVDKTMSVSFTGKKDPSSNSVLKKALNKFTSKSGKEIKRFPNLDIPKRLKMIEENSSVNIGFFLHYQSLFYQDASEALHGSFYGSIFHIGATQPSFDRESVDQANIHLQKNLSLLLLDVGTLIDELIKLIAENSKIDEAKEASNKNLELAGAIFKIAIEDEKVQKY